MATRRLKRRLETTAEIKAISMEIINRTGDVKDVSINGIARKMGMTPPAIYTYFNSRNALIGELVADCYQQYYAQLCEARDTTSGSAGDKIYDVFMAYHNWAVQNPGIFKLLVSRADMEAIAKETPIVATAVQEVNRFFLNLYLQVAAEKGISFPEISDDMATGYNKTISAFRKQPTENDQTGIEVPANIVHQVLKIICLAHGMIAFELAQRMRGLMEDPRWLYHCQIQDQIRIIDPTFHRSYR